jgi:biopolymer transport protein ExbD
MRRRYQLQEKEFSEINITPFTDVILVLLIIFMITSPFLISGSFKVKLPESVNSDSEINRSAEVFLNEGNEIYVNDKQVTLTELPVYLQLEFFNKGNREVIVKADKNVRHGSFVKLLDALKQGGATKLLIATTKATSNSELTQ